MACHLGRGSVGAAKESCEAPAPPTCASVRAGDVGRLPLEVQVGERTVRLEEWTQADESSTSVVGFAARLPSDVVFTVTAGDEEFEGHSGRWLNPHGVAGPRVHPIREVTFCSTVQVSACGSHQLEAVAVR